MASVLNNVLGTKFKNVLGYRSSPEMNLAMQRGEAEGRMTTNLRALFAGTPNGASGFNVIIQGGVKKDKDYPNVPLMREAAREPNEQPVLDFISRVLALARPVATRDAAQNRIAMMTAMATAPDRERLSTSASAITIATKPTRSN